jgi:hypothetical protein
VTADRLIFLLRQRAAISKGASSRLVEMHAVMLGPTLYVQFTLKMFMIAAWNIQVWGREVGNFLPLNLSEFQRNRARLKVAWEF